MEFFVDLQTISRNTHFKTYFNSEVEVILFLWAMGKILKLIKIKNQNKNTIIKYKKIEQWLPLQNDKNADTTFLHSPEIIWFPKLFSNFLWGLYFNFEDLSSLKV